MSPEQLLGQDIDPRSDVYALAIVAYQCLTGDTAFDSKTPDRGLMARLTSEPRPLETVRPDKRWPEELQVVFNKGLSRDRDKRHGSALGFADDFELAAAAKVAPLPKPPKKVPAKVEEKPADKPADKPTAKPPEKPRAPAATPPAFAPPNAQYPMPYPAPHAGYPAPYAAGYSGGAPMYAPGYPPAAAPAAPRTRRWRLPRFPRFPIVRWAGTLFVIWFAYLLITEGSFRRAVRRVTSVVRGVEADARRMVPGGAPAAARGAAGADGSQPTESGAASGSPPDGPGANVPSLGAPPAVVVPPVVQPPRPDTLE